MTGPGGGRRLGVEWLVGGALLLVSLGAWTWMIQTSVNQPATAGPIFFNDIAMMHATMIAEPRVYAAASAPLWFIIIVAMMAPAAVPMLTTHARYTCEAGQSLWATALFALAYVAVWAGFAAVAASVQTLLVETGAILRISQTLGIDRMAGLLLVAAGLYQFTSAKFMCLEHCRSPSSFLTRFWRPGAGDGLVLGFRFAVYCLGCCWLLMSLLFAGGAMSLAWAMGLSGLVLVEKLAPGGRYIGAVVGAVCLLVGAAFIFRLI